MIACLKFFRLKQFVIAISGASALGYKYYSEIINDYNKSEFIDNSLEKTLLDFVNYLDKEYPSDLFPEKKSNQFFFVGYENNLPHMIGMYLLTNKLIIQENGVLVSDEKALKYGFKVASMSMNAYKKIELTFHEYAKGENMTTSIGGPISIIRILPNNNKSYIQNVFQKIHFLLCKIFMKLSKMIK